MEDLLASVGGNYADFLLSIVGGMGSFAYLKFKRAHPQYMVYWSTNTKYLLRNLESIIGFTQLIIEGKSFDRTLSKIKEFIDDGKPVMAGALDMYYLHYYPNIFGKYHVPIHYFSVVGYDDEKQTILLHDCGRKGLEEISYPDLEKSMNVKVPGMSSKNTIRVFNLPKNLPTEFKVAERGFSSKAKQMLTSPVRLFGIPAMYKLAEEIISWNDAKCFRHLITYATTPPELPTTYKHSDGMRFAQSNVLENFGKRYDVNNWIDASKSFRNFGELIIETCKAALIQDSEECSKLIKQIAEVEESAYRLLE